MYSLTVCYSKLIFYCMLYCKAIIIIPQKTTHVMPVFLIYLYIHIYKHQWTPLSSHRGSLCYTKIYSSYIVDIPNFDLIPALDYYCTRSQEIRCLQPFARTDVHVLTTIPLSLSNKDMELSPPPKKFVTCKL